MSGLAVRCRNLKAALVVQVVVVLFVASAVASGGLSPSAVPRCRRRMSDGAHRNYKIAFEPIHKINEI